MKRIIILVLSFCFSTAALCADDKLTYYRDFWNPTFHGKPLSYCLYDNKNCGMAVANRYCQKMGFIKAVKALQAHNLGLTKYLDGCSKCGKTECKGWDCAGFHLIRCLDKVDHEPSQAYYFRERLFVLPRMNNYRLDWCYDLGRGCGSKVANSFCRQMGYRRAKAFAMDSDVHASKEIGNGKLCFGEDCRGFSSITCYR